jgi:hypothetical protein
METIRFIHLDFSPVDDFRVLQSQRDTATLALTGIRIDHVLHRPFAMAKSNQVNCLTPIIGESRHRLQPRHLFAQANRDLRVTDDPAVIIRKVNV